MFSIAVIRYEEVTGRSMPKPEVTGKVIWKPNAVASHGKSLARVREDIYLHLNGIFMLNQKLNTTSGASSVRPA